MTASAKFKIHPAANSFPVMDSNRFAELKADIEARGQIEPITICDGKILDGRHRYRACQELGIKPKTRQFKGNPWEYVWSLNGMRRDLVDEQRYLVWRHCNEKSEAWEAERQRIQQSGNKARSKAAKKQHAVSAPRRGERLVVPQSVVPPKKRPGEEARAAASKTNRGAVARGDKLATVRPDLAEKVRTGDLKPAEAHRQMKRAEVAGKVAKLPTGVYSVVYADPPWKYGDGRTGDLMTATGAQHHYPPMTLAEIKNLGVRELAADDSVLFLWVPSPLLPEGFEVVAAWGFKYKASFVWDKIKHNLGHYNSVRHEFLLVCTRGSHTPENVKLFDSVQTIERGEHSSKPAKFRKIIETLYPSGRKVELFHRGKEPKGWKAWGNESG